MDLVSFISECLAQVQLRLMGTCQGLTQEQVLWRPAPYANNIGFILWHMTRAEDGLISRLGGAQPPLWAADGWHQKFNQPVDAPAPGDRMGLQALPIPDPDILLGYSGVVDQQTRRFMQSLTAGRLEQAVDPSQPQRTVARSLRHMITHKNNHHGQIDYLRGLQEQTWDLPPGTGVVLP